MAEEDSDNMGVTLYPADYEVVEMVTDQGKEILQQEFTEDQLFLHSIQELMRVRAGIKKNQKTENLTEDQSGKIKTEDADGSIDINDTVEKREFVNVDEDDVIDPRNYYRPMVIELQAAVAELHQLINSIDLIRRREFLEEMRCIRENTALQKEELEHVVESKRAQVKESGTILLDGVKTIAKTVKKESVFFLGITHMLRKWKICAPNHGNIPKPFRAGEPLAVDCSYGSAGSSFVPQSQSIADMAYAELSRTERGFVRVKTPENFLARTIQLTLKAKETGKLGKYTLPFPTLINVTRTEMDASDNTPEDLKVLEERNLSILKAVQFSVFCEELFYTLMKEALQYTSKWSDTAYNISNHTIKRQGKDENRLRDTHFLVLQVIDDEVQLRVNERYELTMRLIDVKSLTKDNNLVAGKENDGEKILGAVDEEHSNDSNVKQEDGTSQLAGSSSMPRRVASIPFETSADSDEAFLTQTCRYTILLLQQEIWTRYGRNGISRALLYTGLDFSTIPGGGVSSSKLGLGAVHMTEMDKPDYESGTLATAMKVLAHTLLKSEVARYLDGLSSVLAYQKFQVSSSGRVLDDGLFQPICDSMRGIYVGPRWKTCAFDSTLSAFDLHIGKNFSTEVLISGAQIILQTGIASQRELSGVAGLREFVETAVCSEVASALYRDAVSFGVKQSSMNLDRSSVRLVVTGEWDGSCIGEGRVSDARAVSSIFLEPYFAFDGSLTIDCLLQSVDASKLAPLCHSVADGVHKIKWKQIPGSNDSVKMLWLMQKTGVLLDPLQVSIKSEVPQSDDN
ncbi:hypothetical protein F442_15781 [Plasmopara halstedii]|uniref:Uncharacterized protein n=1 Tax=Plasmopara halstedii TaxID=4781 RepID=A0A0P1A5X6_PLAHL|nr:hypothetical protein F442_15781 [Plasmopara halstedii]CEG35538.1 hypothetical protein F442_15781 [Plasmopara halstedii]|eukprot:XP_024571907.1 hypothetical protein F442_15781 [Plasmopara halstedii]